LERSIDNAGTELPEKKRKRNGKNGTVVLAIREPIIRAGFKFFAVCRIGLMVY
jgi:hypothetical protein